MEFYANNQQTHPFWAFVSEMDNHFGDHRRPPPYGPRERYEREQAAPAEEASTNEKPNDNGKQPAAEDEAMTDAEAPRPSKRGLSDNEKADLDTEKPKEKENKSGESSSDEDHPWGGGRRGGGRHAHGRGHGGRRGGPWGGRGGFGGFGGFGHGPFGPGPAAFGIPFFGPGSPFDDFEGPPPDAQHHPGPPPHFHRNHHRGGPNTEGFGPRGHHGRRHGPHDSDTEGSGGRRSPQGFGPRGHHGKLHCGPHGARAEDFGGRRSPEGFGHHGGPHRGPGHERGFRGQDGPFGRRGGGRFGHGRGGREPFELQNFLRELSTRLGIDIPAAAANFGIDLSRVFPGANRGDAEFIAPHDVFDLPTEYLVHVSLPGARREDIGLDFDGEHNTLRVAGVVHRPGIDEQMNEALRHDGRSHQVGVFETKVRLGKKGEQNIANIDAISAKLRDGILVIHVPKLEKKEEEKKSIRIETPSPSPEPTPTTTTNLAVREKPSSKEPEIDASPAPVSETEKGDQDDNIMDEQDPPEVLPTYAPVNQEEHDEYEEEEDDEDQEGEFVKINVD